MQLTKPFALYLPVSSLAAAHWLTCGVGIYDRSLDRWIIDHCPAGAWEEGAGCTGAATSGSSEFCPVQSCQEEMSTGQSAVYTTGTQSGGGR